MCEACVLVADLEDVARLEDPAGVLAAADGSDLDQHVDVSCRD